MTCLGLVAILALWHFQSILRTSKLISTEIHSSEAKDKASYEAILKLHNNTGGASRDFSCTKAQNTVGLITIDRSLCALSFPDPGVFESRALLDGSQNSDALIFPAFDFQAILARSTSCTKSQLENWSIMPSGYRLSSGSSISSELCTESSHARLNRVLVISNLSIPEKLTLSPGANGAALIASAGFTDIADTLTLEGDGVIISGGDLYVKNLAADPTRKQHITLISTTGVVTVENINGDIDLQVFGREGVYLPENSVLEASNNLPRVLKTIVVSLTP